MSRRVATHVVAGVLSSVVGLALWRAIGVRPTPAVSLPALVRDTMPASGVSHDITAVLLNFRSYDTLLEIAVLLAAAVVALALRDAPGDREQTGQSNLILDTFVWRLTPLLILVAAYLLWAGSTRPGGAFQAGAVLAGAAVLLRLSGLSMFSIDDRFATRVSVVFGLAVFLLVAAGTLLARQSLLAYPPEWAGALILMIEAALTVSIAVVLFSLFDNAPQVHAAEREDAPGSAA